MTITQTIPKIAEVTHPGRQISEEVAEAWRRVHITAWEFEGNIRPTNWTVEDSWVEARKLETDRGRDVVRKASTQQSRLPGSSWAAMENEKDTTLTAITLGSKYFSYVRSPAPSHMQTLNNLFETLQIKWEVKILLKKSSCVCLCHCVFIIASVIHACVFIIASVCIQYIYIYVYLCMNQQMTIQYMSMYSHMRFHQFVTWNIPTVVFLPIFLS